MGRIEQKCALVLNQVPAGLVTMEAAALLLGRSVRQVQRLQAAYRARGPAALVHGNRGRRPVWTTAPETAARIVALAQGPYAAFNQQHLTEMLAEREGIQLSRSTVRRVLLPTADRRSWVKARVEVPERLDGSRALVYQGQEIPHRSAPADAASRRRTLIAPIAVTAVAPTPIGRRPAASRHRPPRTPGASIGGDTRTALQQRQIP